MSLDPRRVQALVDRARRDVDEGTLPSCQLALALHGELVLDEAFGDATTDTRYTIFSSTKPIVAAAIWSVMGDGLLDVTRRVVDYVPEFGTNDKDVVTIEQVLLHTSGFPSAPLGPPKWATHEGRMAAFAKWRLSWEPGTSFEYHSTSAHWVLAELLERVTGQDFRDVVEARVTKPLGLPRVLGIAPGPDQDEIAPLSLFGEAATPEEMVAVFGVEQLAANEATDQALLSFDLPEIREVGVPGGGGILRASDLARFYQALLHNPGEVWRPDILADVTTNVRNRFPERTVGWPANRTLGLVLAGDDGNSHFRGMGRGLSAGAFGHPGARGQLSWADPATGLSFGYVTNGLDRNKANETKRSCDLVALAAACVSA